MDVYKSQIYENPDVHDPKLFSVMDKDQEVLATPPPYNRVPKMTNKDIYRSYYTRNKTPDLLTNQDDKNKSKLRIHASHGNNLLGDVKDEVNQYV